MKLKRLWPAGVLALVLAAGVLAGSALAGGRSVSNAAVGKAAITPHFSTGTAVKVKGAAVINSNGTVARASTLPFAVASSTHLSTGVYDLRFNKNITACAWLGSVGLAGFAGSTGDATIQLTGRAGTTTGLFITTFNGAGAATDEPFHVIVIC